MHGGGSGLQRPSPVSGARTLTVTRRVEATGAAGLWFYEDALGRTHEPGSYREVTGSAGAGRAHPSGTPAFRRPSKRLALGPINRIVARRASTGLRDCEGWTKREPSFGCSPRFIVSCEMGKAGYVEPNNIQALRTHEFEVSVFCGSITPHR